MEGTTGRPQMFHDVPERNEVERRGGKGLGRLFEAHRTDIELEVLAGVFGGGGGGFEPHNGAVGPVAQSGEETAQVAADIEDPRLGVHRRGGKDAAKLETIDPFELARDEPLTQRRIPGGRAELVD